MLILLPQPLTADEKAWSLFEEDKLTPNGKALHRYQTVRVLRDGRVVEYELDLGSSFNFSVEPFYIPAFRMMTVGQVLEQAALLRRDGTGLQQAMEEHKNEVNVITSFVDQVEMVTDFIKRNPVTFASIKRQKEGLANGKA